MPKARSTLDAVQNDHDMKTSNVTTTATTTTTTVNTTIELPENSRIVQPSYLEKNTGKVSDVGYDLKIPLFLNSSDDYLSSSIFRVFVTKIERFGTAVA
jgi:hypothetical protein